MNEHRLREIVDASLAQVRELWGWSDQRWFEPGLAGQGKATTLAWAVVTRLADELLHGNAHGALWAPWHGRKHHDWRSRIVEQNWVRGHARRRHETREFLVDFSVWSARSEHRATLIAESEMYSDHAVDEEGDYAWDFAKVLAVQAPARLFLARVPTPRRAALLTTLDRMTNRALHDQIRPGTWLAIVLLDEVPIEGQSGFTIQWTQSPIG